jgi:hypothetical protein
MPHNTKSNFEIKNLQENESILQKLVKLSLQLLGEGVGVVGVKRQIRWERGLGLYRLVVG